MFLALGALGLVGASAAVAKHYLLARSYVPDETELAVSLQELRVLSSTAPGELPVAINRLITAEGELIPWTIMAGDSTVPHQYVQTSFQIVFADKAIVVDAPMDEEQCEEFEYCQQFFADHYDSLQRAMRDADLLLFTHEHQDHVGGLAKSAHFHELAGKAVLTREQVDSTLIERGDFPADGFAKIEPLDYDDHHLVAPGVVLMKAPGHTPGHQMLYVLLQNGHEFVFAGDSVWSLANVERLRSRSLLVNLVGGEDRTQVGHEIRWLHDEIYWNEVHIVPSHDPRVINRYVQEGLIGGAFAF